MKFRIVKNAWWMFWAKGMVVWPWVWFKKGSVNDDIIFRHELEHCYQIKKQGRFKFYSSYLLLWCRRGYETHPYEIEARAAANKKLLKREIRWRKRGRIEL